MTEWICDPHKDRLNRLKHDGLSLADGIWALADPLSMSRLDPHPDGDRWQTIGVSGRIITLFVVHTLPAIDSDGEPKGRIISVRRATRRERKAYEESIF